MPHKNINMITKEDLKQARDYIFSPSNTENPFIEFDLHLKEENIQRCLDGKISAEELTLTESGDIKVTFKNKE